MLTQPAPGHAQLSGALDMDNCAALLPALTRLAQQGNLSVDLSSVSHADSAALALLLAAQRQAKQAGHTLSIQSWPEGLRSLLELYTMTDLFPACSGA